MERSKSIKKKYEALLRSEDYLDSVISQTSDKKKYNERIKIAYELLS